MRCTTRELSLWRVGALLLVVTLAACRDQSTAPAPASTASQRAAAPTLRGTTMILATTTSTRDSGLLDALMPAFERHSGVKVKVIAVGTGAALRMASKGDADAVLVHAPAAEKKYVDSGDLVEGRLVMHNDFVLLGPTDDPAGVRGKASLDEALGALAKGATFVSRGDDSGTHNKELALWRDAGVDPAAGKWRVETGQGMGATLNVANERGAYTLSDRGTYLAFKPRLKLAVLLEGDERLLNCYHIHLVNPAKHRAAKVGQARALVAFFVAEETQKLISEHGRVKYGEPLFVPDAMPGSQPAGSDSGAPSDSDGEVVTPKAAGSGRPAARCKP